MDAKTLYEVYSTHSPLIVPEWDDLNPAWRYTWNKTAAQAFKPNLDLALDNREIKTIGACVNYARNFKDVGLPGHNLMLLVAKLAKREGFVE